MTCPALPCPALPCLALPCPLLRRKFTEQETLEIKTHTGMCITLVNKTPVSRSSIQHRREVIKRTTLLLMYGKIDAYRVQSNAIRPK